ncbi:MAG: HD-GYP domain-containing protein [Candidatus Aquicultor sp.]
MNNGKAIFHNDQESSSQEPEESHYGDILHALVKRIEGEESCQQGHSERVAVFAELIGHELGLSPEQVDHLRIAGHLHDIGKVAISELILKKTEPLTDRELQELKLHTIIGERIVAKTGLQLIAQAVLYHHERLDGSGYPYGLKGDEIPLYARIVAVADSFEVMVSNRPYKKAFTVEEALKELEDNSSTTLDRNIVRVLTRIIMNDDAARKIV